MKISKRMKKILIVIFILIFILALLLLPKHSIRNTAKLFQDNTTKYFNKFNCIEGGETISYLHKSEKCCKGLKEIPIGGLYKNGCSWLQGTSALCSKCGDGICKIELGENLCNCPEDCQIEDHKKIDEQKQNDPRCNWNPGLCKNICQSQNYYYDEKSNQCYKYIENNEAKGCCTPPPFTSLILCQNACEKIDYGFLEECKKQNEIICGPSFCPVIR